MSETDAIQNEHETICRMVKVAILHRDARIEKLNAKTHILRDALEAIMAGEEDSPALGRACQLIAQEALRDFGA